MKEVTAVVVTYNRKLLLKQNIQSLLGKSGNEKLNIIIVDNASTDGTYDEIKPYLQHENVIYQNTGKNIGGAGGFNYGIKIALKTQCEYIWLMDDDTMPEPDALERLLEADEQLKGNYGFLSSNVLWKDNSLCLMNMQAYYRKKIYPDKYKKNLIRVTQATFVSILFKVDTVKKIGLPIKDFFIWCDDVEYTRRMSVVNKLPCYMVKASRVHHLMEKNTGSNIAIDVEERISRYRYAYRNEFYTYRREGLARLLYFCARCVYHMMRIMVCAKNSRWRRIITLLSGFAAGLIFYPDIEYIENEK